MANSSTLKAQILDMHPVGDRMRISVRFDDGKGEPWNQAFDIKYDRSISLEEFSVMLGEKEKFEQIRRPDDPYIYLKQAKESKAVFDVKRHEESGK